MDPQARRYIVTVSYELVPRDGSPSDGTRMRTGTIWATSVEDAGAKMEHWAKLEFRRAGFEVVAHASGGRLAP